MLNRTFFAQRPSPHCSSVYVNSVGGALFGDSVCTLCINYVARRKAALKCTVKFCELLTVQCSRSESEIRKDVVSGKEIKTKPCIVLVHLYALVIPRRHVAEVPIRLRDPLHPPL